MAERDKVIKSGQLTLPRLLFLVVVGGLIVFTVYKGGIFLSIGYWLLTLAICGLLILIAIDYGVSMDKVSLSSGQTPETAGSIAESTSTEVRTTMGDAARAPKVKRRASRPAKRRR